MSGGAMKDALDERLLQLLRTDARQPSRELARQLSVSPATVRRRLRKLIESGVLRFLAVADPERMGYHLTAIIALSVTHDRARSVLQFLAMRPQVKWVSTTTGRFDVLALMQFRSTDELAQFLGKELSGIEGIRDSETFICLHTEKGA